MGKVTDLVGIEFPDSYTDELWSILEDGDIQRLLDAGTRIACQVTPSDSSLILLRLSNTDQSRYASVYRVPQELLAYTVDMSKSIGNYTILQARPILIDDYSNHPRKIPLLDGFGYKQVLSVPIMWKGQCFGALNVHTSRHKVYGPEHVERLTRISRVIAVGLYQRFLSAEHSLWDKMVVGLTRIDRLQGNFQRVEELMSEILRILDDIFGAKVAVCWRHPGSGTMEISSHASLSFREQEALEGLSKTALQFTSLKEQSIEMEIPGGEEADRVTFFPLVLSQFPLGAVVVFGSASLPQSTLEAGKVLIARIAHMLGNLFLRDDTPEPNQLAKATDVQRLVELVAQLGTLPPLQRMPQIAQGLHGYFNADAAWVYSQEPSGDEGTFELLALSGAGLTLPTELKIQEPIWRKIAAAGKLIPISHMNSSHSQGTWEPFRQSGLNSMLIVSVPTQGQMLLIGVGWMTPMAFGAREKSLLQTFVSLGRVLLAEYYRERYYREQVSQLHGHLDKMSSHAEETQATNHYLASLVAALQESDPLNGVLKAIRQIAQANPRFEDGLGTVLYSLDDTDSYLGIALTPSQWDVLSQGGSLVVGSHLCFQVSLDVPCSLILVVSSYSQGHPQSGDFLEKIRMALPVLRQAVQQAVDFRWELQVWRTECLLALGKPAAEDSMFHLRRHLLRIPVAAEYRVGILRGEGIAAPKARLDVVDILQRGCSALRFFVYEDDVLFLAASQNGGKPEDVYCLQKVIHEHSVLSGLQLRAGVSSAFGGLQKMSQAVMEAQKALEANRTEDQDSWLCFYDDLNIFSVLVNPTNLPVIRTFIHGLLDPLIEYDNKHQANLVLTLKQFLDCGGVLQDAAASLFLHVNSLKYRLRKIESMLKVSLDDPNIRLQLQMSLRFLEALDGLDAVLQANGGVR